MDILSNLKHADGAVKKRKRIARGEGSGRGGQATKGMNGQRSRSGHKNRAWFEGGQMPLQRRVPKRGFHNHFRVEFQPVNVARLQNLVDDNKVEENNFTPAVLYKLGVISKATAPYKILGNGELTAKITIEAHKVSAAAKVKIEAAGGTVKEISL
ncbi:MAG: 50S ribosomal protein L15 [Melioribacteraceae bacterium]|nr:50S ribosomal protein L15 [Melioribacteraceae bacterium]MCF8354683.1 50S ribosomal protein L15 [Melioribacteraceae bacterium]MCF8393585.1 50S ribosomal protein L15 [Melioribacteraceae bacterium]MCF8419395.1 50S ribosomal protein L15 [Melioribacteraceae bacterium]